MDRINLPTPRASSVTPPPVVPPPVVPPPLPSEVLPTGGELPATSPVVPSRQRRVVFNVKIGGFCLLFGLLLGQSGLLDRSAQPAPISTLASTSHSPLLDDVPLGPELKVEAQPTSLTEAVEGFEREQLQQLVSIDRSLDPPANPFVESPAQKLAESVDELQQTDLSGDRDVGASAVTEAVEDPTQAMVQHAAEAWANIPGKESEPAAIDSMASLIPQSRAAHPQCETGSCPQRMESHGTALQWADMPADAYRAAGQQGKLVFLIHVSGNFKIPGFT